MKTKEQIWEIKDELKEIWLEHKDDFSLRDIFDEYMTDYFETAGTDDFKSVEWMTVVSLTAKWTRELRSEKKKERAKEIKGQSTDEIQEGNRIKMIHILRKTLDAYEDNPKKLKNISLSDVKGLYKIIQNLEEIKKKTDIERGRLKLDTFKSVLPYQRLSPEKLTELQKSITASFDRMGKFESGELVVAKIEEPDESEIEQD